MRHLGVVLLTWLSFAWLMPSLAHAQNVVAETFMIPAADPGIQIKNHQLSWWFDGEPLKAVLKDSATFGMGLWDH